MKLVATVKLQKAKEKAEAARPYFDAMYENVLTMLARTKNVEHRYLKAGTSPKKGLIVITANRGLAGGYNSSITRLVADSGIPKDECVIYAVGIKGRDYFSRRKYDIAADYSEVINEPIYSDAMEIGRRVLADFESGKIGEIYLVYTQFKNTVVHTPQMVKLLPLSQEDIGENAEDATGALMTYEPEEEEALSIIIPKYINSLIYGALMESIASENGARMTAMDNATNNADEMINDLSLKYNRARQSSITQELTEIIAGANAIS
jgi:F-type H+-transporting ATPase subunit gamma